MRTSKQTCESSRARMVLITCSVWFCRLFLGFKGWIGDYMRLAIRGDLIDRFVGRYLLPCFICLSVYFLGDYLIGVVGQKLKKEAGHDQQQSYMQEELTNDNFAASISPQNNFIGGDVTGEDKRIYPDYYGPNKGKYEAKFFHNSILLQNSYILPDSVRVLTGRILVKMWGLGRGVTK
jgi:hypothetical protein